LESLEARDVPSTLTVTNNLDDGSKGSLRYELARAHNKDTIVFAPSLDGQTITLTSGELLITDSGLTIKGPGANLLTVSGGHTSRVFEEAENVQAAISGLTISNGSSYDGGAIYNAGGVLTLTGCTVSGNYAFDDGGAIYSAGGVLTLTGCTVSGNYAAHDSGGGIYNPLGSHVDLSGCTLSNNTAAVEGGGLYNDGGATVSSCTVSGNSAARGGGISSLNGGLWVRDTIFSGNVPDAIEANYTDGGGNTFH
jgi:predicted outer membrane repeat protein